MRRVTVRAVAAAALVSVAPSCGDEPAVPSPSPDAITPAAVAEAKARAAAPTTTASTAEVDVRWTAWRDARDPSEERRAADALLAAGAPALERLLAALSKDSEDFDYRVTDLIREFGASAVKPLTRLLQSEDACLRSRAIDVLGDMAPVWAFGDLGPGVCKQVLARVADEEDFRSALWALEKSRPAVRAVAAELAALWSRAEDGRRELLSETLQALGPDAADAWPVLWAALTAPPVTSSEDAADGDVSRRVEALEIVGACRGGDPALVEPLRTLLADRSPEVRSRALSLLTGYGDAAAAAAPQITAFLKDEDGDVREAAWLALLAMPSMADRVWRDVAAAAATSAAATQVLLAFTKDPARAARIAKELPDLPASDFAAAYEALCQGGAIDMSTLTATLLHHRLPEARALSLRAWHWADRPDPLPDGALALLDDPDPRVRAHAAESLAGWESAPASKVRDVAFPLLAAEDDEVRRAAVAALGSFVGSDAQRTDALLRAARDPDGGVRRTALDGLSRVAAREPRAMSALVEALADEAGGSIYVAIRALGPLADESPQAFDALASVIANRESLRRANALGALRDETTPIRGDHAALVATLGRDLFTEREPSSRLVADFLLRLDGGCEAVVQAITRAIDAEDDEGRRHLQPALEEAQSLGPRAASLRPALVRRRATADAYWQYNLDRTLAAIDGKGEPPADPSDEVETIVRSSADEAEKVARLLALGDAGRRALVRVAAETADANALLQRLAPVADKSLRDAVVEAAGATGDDRASVARRHGAAVLAPLLPPSEAVPLLIRLHDLSDGGPVEPAMMALATVEARAPGSVPVAYAAKLLRDDEGRRDWDGIPLAERIGPRIVAADPDLVSELRRMRDTGVDPYERPEDASPTGAAGSSDDAGPAMWRRCAAASVLWHITRDANEALPLFRSILAHPERIGRRDDQQIPWRTVGAALAEMPLGDEEVAAIVVTLRFASAYVPRDDRQGEAPGTADSFAGAIGPLCAVVTRLGPRGAPAVPALRVALRHWQSAESDRIVTTLAAIGPAAQDAVPDIRAWARFNRSARAPIARDAIRRIEAR